MDCSVTFWIAALVVLVSEVETIPKSGPFDILTNKIVMCKDVGTNEVSFAGKMSSKGNGATVYNSDVDFRVPWDDKLKIDAEFQQLSNGGYTSKFVTHGFENCERIWKVAKYTMRSFFAAAGYNFTGCPLPAGIYPVKDWPVYVKLDLPSFFYGSYKLIVAFSKDNRRVGCFIIYCDIVQKKT